jgi:hypothetical protein
LWRLTEAVHLVLETALSASPVILFVLCCFNWYGTLLGPLRLGCAPGMLVLQIVTTKWALDLRTCKCATSPCQGTLDASCLAPCNNVWLHGCLTVASPAGDGAVGMWGKGAAACMHAKLCVFPSATRHPDARTHARTGYGHRHQAHNVTTPPLLIRVCVASRVDRFWPQRPPQGVYMVCANPFWIFGYTSATITVQYTGSRLLSRSWAFSTSTPEGRGSCATFSIGTAGLVRGSGWGDPHYRLLDGRYV